MLQPPKTLAPGYSHPMYLHVTVQEISIRRIREHAKRPPSGMKSCQQAREFRMIRWQQRCSIGSRSSRTLLRWHFPASSNKCGDLPNHLRYYMVKYVPVNAVRFSGLPPPAQPNLQARHSAKYKNTCVPRRFFQQPSPSFCLFNFPGRPPSYLRPRWAAPSPLRCPSPTGRIRRGQ
jgi:hypothetical protein